jgi:hypothetical protein
MFDQYPPLLQQLSWLPVQSRIIFKACVIVFKCIHGSAPPYIRDLVHKQERNSRLRQPRSNNLQIQHSRRKIGESSFQVCAPLIWNQLPHELKCIDKLYSFRKKLKRTSGTYITTDQDTIVTSTHIPSGC